MRWRIFLGNYEKAFRDSLQFVASQNVVMRLWNKDYTLWGKQPEEIVDRLDWLEAPCRMRGMVKSLRDLANTIREAGFTKVLLLGMGGSSLAPLMFAEAFPKGKESLPLHVLDTTDPEEIRAHADTPATTFYIVSTKSGTTLETAVLFRYFYTLLGEHGVTNPGAHFMAITDPGSPLVTEAQKYRFRSIFCNNPNIGGRYSIFSFFGLLPAALLGIDLVTLLSEAQKGMETCFPDHPIETNKGVIFGTFLGSLALSGCDKVVFLFPSPRFATFGMWLEQLIAESTGKNGKGILPVVRKRPVALPREDVAYVVFFENEDDHLVRFLSVLERNGSPYMAIPVETPYALGEQAYLFAFAVALSGHLLGINPFDQPDVELTKRFTREMMFHAKKGISLEKAQNDGTITFLWEEGAASFSEAFKRFLGRLKKDGYLTIQAFTPYSGDLAKSLETLATAIEERYRTLVTLGYGPRYLHSTGQLHKGDGGKGSFLQVITESGEDLPIPDEAGKPGSSFSFGTLKKIQALADREALRERGRNVLTIILPREETQRALTHIAALLTEM
ncbi:hypothetical protein [Candidatus Caldatribacterium sp.]|uniref:hypothetical protein n=1 Tax=Candidatus Caldatribacterium sp. TaxID=2282143 RepID=UPI0029936F6A|nr:hypothetical protein [Candidatus Caldatribacterium sp.]MDW8080553.1 hypothetical protein [Candidatus Calescibacterium sp.]